MLGGLSRSDGVPVLNVANPLKVGYDSTKPAGGYIPLAVQTSVPEGVVVTNGLLREGLSTSAAFQFHDLGGISVEVMDDDPATGSGNDATMLSPHQNAEHWLSEATRLATAVRVPYIVWNQGEADVSRPRGWWLSAFRLTYGDMLAQVTRTTGQAAPKLFMWQTGGYMFNTNTNPHAVKLDQLEAAREFGGVLIGPLYPYPIDNADGKGVHKTGVGYLTAFETTVWAMVEDQAGRKWSIPAPTAVRSGANITLTFDLRGDETLTGETGLYAAYGGDPANMGFEAMGGGSITGVTLGANTVTLATTGTVTGIKYAMQATATDYRTLTVNNVGFCSHRGTLRTTLTKTVTLGGQELLLKRWVPSFEITV